jgi:hypothetical protein
VAKKNPKNVERRAMVEQMRKEQARKERNRSMLILGVCVVAVLGLLGAALVPYLKDRNEDKALADKSITKIGVSEAAASCDDILTKPTDKSQNHVPDGPITYEDAPPAFGNHRPVAAAFERKFYTADDRPEVAQLVHNLEHGYTILWYDDTVADDDAAVTDLRAMASKFPDVSDPAQKIIIAPWTADDGGKPFPDGAHLAFTHWSMGGTNGNPDGQVGVWEYCGKVSGQAVTDFMDDYPSSDSPEPGAF